jgi:16S rRNA (cytidine1402-2'-O)-methyltransferase
MEPTSGTLSVVATPIGNLEDMTYRAVRVLRAADYILCEDSRVTGRLLKHYDIVSPLKRYDAHTPERVHEEILADLAAGKRLALVSDAGTPGVSDPGVLLVARARLAGARIDAIPGPSALTAALSIAGLTGNQFTFLGFVPHKKGRQTFFTALTEYDHPVVFFESTHRIMKTLEALETTVANSPIDWTISIAREITKLHEEFVSGTPTEIREYFTAHVEHQRGEFVVLVSPAVY